MGFEFVEKVMCIGSGSPSPILQFYKKGFVLGGISTPTWQDIILSGVGALTLTNALANSLLSLKLSGGTEQNGTPTPDTPMDIVCNNGVVKLNNVHNIATDTLGGYINFGFTYDNEKIWIKLSPAGNEKAIVVFS